jgi:hypothetical protein
MIYLVPTGCILLIVSLVLAWILVGVRFLKIPVLIRLFPNDTDLLRCHIDYILMALVLLVFGALRPPIPLWLAACLIVGATTNPILFIITAMYPRHRALPPVWFKAITTLSFIIATLGFGGTALVLFQASLPA